MSETAAWTERVLGSLGHAILHSLWQAGIIWLLVILVLKTYKNLTPKQGGGLVFLATTAAGCSFVVTWVYLLLLPTHPINLAPSFAGVGTATKVYHALAISYLFIFLFQLARLGTGFYRVQKLKVVGLEQVPGHLKIFTLDASSYLGIKKQVKIYLSHLVGAPVTFGFLKPVVLLPVSIVTHLSPLQLEAVILHELAHIKRNDYLVNWVNQLVKAVLYFNPFVHGLVRLQRSEREKNADNWVLQFQYDPKLYATALYEIAASQKRPQPQLALSVTGHCYELLNRIECIFGNKSRLLPGSRALLANIGLLVLFCCASFLYTRAPQHSPTASVEATGTIAKHFLVGLGFEEGPIQKNKIHTEPVGYEPEKQVAAAQKVQTQRASLKEDRSTDILPDPSVPNSIQFVNTVVGQQLSDRDEKALDAAIGAAVRIFAEESWKNIELQLAESMTDPQKLLFKDQYIQLLAQANWSDLKNRLRFNFPKINWDSASAVLQGEVNHLLLDSLYNHYSLAQRQLEQEITAAGNVSPQLEKTDVGLAIEKALPHIKSVLEKVDSLRRKKIIEL